MGGVDLTDQMISAYDATRKALKWYRKLVIHFVQISMLSAFILYKKANAGSKMRFMKFQMQVIKSLIAVDPQGDVTVTTDKTVARLSGRHFLTHAPDTAKGVKKKLHTRRCRVCQKKGIRREVTFICSQCPSKPALCPVPCFEPYHTKIQYA